MFTFLRILLQHRDLFALILTTTFSLIVLFSNDTAPVHSLQGKIADIFITFLKPQQWYREIISVKEENRVLKEKITKLNLQNIKLEHFAQENQRLKEMLNFTKESTWTLRPANIVRQSFSPSTHSFTINIGSKEGIQKNQPAIDMYGLIGKTYVTGKHSTIIQTLTDKNFRVSIRVGENRILGIFIPTHGSYGIIEGIPKSQSVSENNIVVTSGISDIYPPDIPIAEVISVSINPNQLFQNIVVEILSDIYNPDYVFVIE